MLKRLLYLYVKYRHKLSIATISAALVAILVAILIRIVQCNSALYCEVENSGVTQSLLYVGASLLMIVQLPIVLKCSDRFWGVVKKLTLWYLAISLLLFTAYLLDMFTNIIWLVGVEMVIFSSLFIDVIDKSRRIKGCDIIKMSSFITFYSIALVVAIILIPLSLKEIFDGSGWVSILDVIPIIAISMGLVNMLVGYNIVHSYCRGSHHNRELLISLLLIVAILWFFSVEMGFVMLSLSVVVAMVISKPNRFSNLTIFYIILILMSVVTAIKMSQLSTIYIFSVPLYLSDGVEPMGFYESIADRTIISGGNLLRKIKFTHLLTILCYTSLLSITVGLLLLRKRLFDVNIGRSTAKDRVWKTVSISLYGVILATILIGKSFSKDINRETQKICITEMSKTLVADYLYRNCDLSEWVDQKKRIHRIDMDLYNCNGELLSVGKRDETIRVSCPVLLPRVILNSISKNSVVINEERYNNNEDYISAYMILDDDIILRIPLNPRFIITKYTPLISKAINISIISLLLIVTYFTLSYHKQIKPFKFLRNNRKRISSHKKIAIPPSIKGNYELNYLLHEYNNMVNELSQWHSLQMVVERQILYDRTMRMVAHEIKNPLTPMLMMSQLSLRLIEDGDPKALVTVERSLHTIIEQTKRINELIAKMMNNKDSVSISSEQGNISKVVVDVIKFYSLNTQITFKQEGVASDDNICTNVTERDLWSVISNIVINAIDAIVQSNQSDGEISLSLTYDDKFALLTIRNNGLAIDPLSVDKLFDYNYTTKPNGNGLGLFVSLQIVKYAGGYICLNNSDEHYTEFEIAFPVSEKL